MTGFDDNPMSLFDLFFENIDKQKENMSENRMQEKEYMLHKAATIKQYIKIPLKYYQTGCDWCINYEKRKICKNCKGIGGFNPRDCQVCSAKGFVIVETQKYGAVIEDKKHCYVCDGKGKQYTKCAYCPYSQGFFDSKIKVCAYLSYFLFVCLFVCLCFCLENKNI